MDVSASSQTHLNDDDETYDVTQVKWIGLPARGLNQQDARFVRWAWFAQKNKNCLLAPTIQQINRKSSSRKAQKSTQPPAQRRILSLSLRCVPEVRSQVHKRNTSRREKNISWWCALCTWSQFSPEFSRSRPEAFFSFISEKPSAISSQETDASWGLCSVRLQLHTKPYSRAPLRMKI